MHPRFKLWLSADDTEGIFGDGKWRLLKAIDAEGSLQAAAQSLGISYRKAWGDLQKAEKHLGLTLIEKKRGGRSGGSAHLTKAGKQLMTGYSRLRSSLETSARKGYDKHISPVLES